MKKNLFLPASLFGALLFSWPIQAHSQDLAKIIQTASGRLLDQSASTNQIQNALLQLLDAAVLALPKSEHSGNARSAMQAAREELSKNAVLSQKGYEHLSVAYRALNSGKDFQFPEVSSMEQAKAGIQERIAASVAGLKNAQAGLTSKLLLECLIMVLTPIPR